MDQRRCHIFEISNWANKTGHYGKGVLMHPYASCAGDTAPAVSKATEVVNAITGILGAIMPGVTSIAGYALTKNSGSSSVQSPYQGYSSYQQPQVIEVPAVTQNMTPMYVMIGAAAVLGLGTIILTARRTRRG